MTFTIDKIMKYPVITVTPQESIAKTTKKMDQYKVGGLPVVEEGKLIGIITSRNIRASHPNRMVCDVMSKNPITIQKTFPLWRAYQLMEKFQIERLPVLDGNNLVGIVTKSDLLLEQGKHIDPLTELHTSSYIRFVGETLLSEGKKITVLFFDLNNFGEFNKEFGHCVGDKCLQTIGKTLLSEVQPEKDHLCRYGGDEFVVITERTKEEAHSWAINVIDKVKQSFEGQLFHVEITVGLAGGHRKQNRNIHSAALLDELINLASLASTKAKKEYLPVLIRE